MYRIFTRCRKYHKREIRNVEKKTTFKRSGKKKKKEDESIGSGELCSLAKNNNRLECEWVP